MTLLTVGNSEGDRRCDAKCYDAQHPDCDCVCGGKNHGAGLNRALDNVREMFLGALDKAGDVQVAQECRRLFEIQKNQGNLFPQEAA